MLQGLSSSHRGVVRKYHYPHASSSRLAYQGKVSESRRSLGHRRHRAASQAATPHGKVSVMWYSLVKVQFSITRKISVLRDNALHDMRIWSRQCFADPQKEICLRWCHLSRSWFIPISEFYTPSVANHCNDRVRERKDLQISVDGRARSVVFRHQISHSHLTDATQ